MASLRPSLEMVTRDLRPSLMSLRSRKRNGSSEEGEDLIYSTSDDNKYKKNLVRCGWNRRLHSLMPLWPRTCAEPSREEGENRNTIRIGYRYGELNFLTTNAYKLTRIATRDLTPFPYGPTTQETQWKERRGRGSEELVRTRKTHFSRL